MHPFEAEDYTQTENEMQNPSQSTQKQTATDSKEKRREEGGRPREAYKSAPCLPSCDGMMRRWPLALQMLPVCGDKSLQVTGEGS